MPESDSVHLPESSADDSWHEGNKFHPGVFTARCLRSRLVDLKSVFQVFELHGFRGASLIKNSK